MELEIEICIGVVVSIFLLYGVIIYNRFVNLKNKIEKTFHRLKTTAKRRFGMIKSMAEVVKSHGRGVKIDMVNDIKIESVKDIEKAERDARKLMQNVLAAVKKQRGVEKMETVRDLQEAIEKAGREMERLVYVYNQMVDEFNILCERFPTNIFAGLFGFEKKPPLKLE